MSKQQYKIDLKHNPFKFNNKNKRTSKTIKTATGNGTEQKRKTVLHFKCFYARLSINVLFRIQSSSTFNFHNIALQLPVYLLLCLQWTKEIYRETLVKWSQSNAFVFIIRCLNSVLLYNLHALMPFVLFIYTLL